jgi:UDP-2-acetamido-3-amino-2,3-dideoxy-glucuronate N-acetyltransferase
VGVDVSEAGSTPLVGGASLIRLPEVVDHRGHLTYAEVDGLLPFVVQRYFLIFGVPDASVRGEHAHRILQELLVCTSGSVRVTITDGRDSDEVVLDEPTVGLYLPPMLWATQTGYEPSTVLLVLCSEKYDPDDYIRDFDQYVAEFG